MTEQRIYVVYFLASGPYGTLYIGVTNDLLRRMQEHREGRVPGFTKRYRVTKLMYFEEFADIADAIQREKSLKEWPRAWKINLIERINPHWQDMFLAIGEAESDPPPFGTSIEMGPGHKARDDT